MAFLLKYYDVIAICCGLYLGLVFAKHGSNMAILLKYYDVIATCGGLYLGLVFAQHAQTLTQETYAE
jgi:hypothetical protein